MLQAWLLDGSEGKAIKLWAYDSDDHIAVLTETKARLARVGERVLPPKSVLVLRDTDEPPDMQAYKERTAPGYRVLKSGAIASLRGKKGTLFERLNGFVQERSRKRIVAQLNELETQKLEECERDQAFGLEQLLQGAANDDRECWPHAMRKAR